MTTLPRHLTGHSERSFSAGFEAYKRYYQLVRSQNLPFVRTSGSDRVMQSSLNWTAGKGFSSETDVHQANSPLRIFCF